MLTRSSLSKPVARQRVGHPSLHWRVASRRLPEHEFIADGTRLADGTRAGDFPLFPPVRRKQFRRRDTRYRRAREFPQLALPRYPLARANQPRSRIEISLQNHFPAIYRRFRPFIWRARVQRLRRINHLAGRPFFSPFKNGENGKNGIASKRRREASQSSCFRRRGRMRLVRCRSSRCGPGDWNRARSVAPSTALRGRSSGSP